MISYVAVDSSGMPIIQKNDLERVAWMHSTAKPIQLLPFLDRGLHQKYALTKEEVVVLASSHLAQPQHVDALLSIFRKAELKEEDMVLPPSAPQGKRSYQDWIKNCGKTRKIYHPCSGNHAAIMLLQRELTGSTVGYEQVDSPAQQEILQYIEAYAETKALLKKDNCGIPTYGIPLQKLAFCYQKLATACPQSIVGHFIDAIHTAPIMLEGDGCISTILCSDYHLIAKTGINNLLAIGVQSQYVGIAIQTENGWENVIQTLCEISSQIGVISEAIVCELRHITYL